CHISFDCQIWYHGTNFGSFFQAQFFLNLKKFAWEFCHNNTFPNGPSDCYIEITKGQHPLEVLADPDKSFSEKPCRKTPPSWFCETSHRCHLFAVNLPLFACDQSLQHLNKAERRDFLRYRNTLFPCQ